jgi:hypothetical protein
MVRIFFRNWNFCARKQHFIESVAAFCFRHNQCTDDINDDGWSWQKGEDEKSDSQKIGINIKILCKSTQYSEQPLLLMIWLMFYSDSMSAPLFIIICAHCIGVKLKNDEKKMKDR